MLSLRLVVARNVLYIIMATFVRGYVDPQGVPLLDPRYFAVRLHIMASVLHSFPVQNHF
jgi:hypothetical protein